MAEETFSQTSAWPRRRRRRRSNRAHIDYNEMSVRYGSVKLQLPTGFKSLLEHLTREILREQPANIPEFAAAYFKHLLQKREDGVPDPAYLINERITETAGAGELQPAVVDEPVVESPTQDEEPAAQPAASEQADEEMPDLNDPEVAKAATLIQASFRGFQVRKSLSPQQSPTHKDVEYLRGLSSASTSSVMAAGTSADAIDSAVLTIDDVATTGTKHDSASSLYVTVSETTPDILESPASPGQRRHSDTAKPAVASAPAVPQGPKSSPAVGQAIGNQKAVDIASVSEAGSAVEKDQGVTEAVGQEDVEVSEVVQDTAVADEEKAVDAASNSQLVSPDSNNPEESSLPVVDSKDESVEESVIAASSSEIANVVSDSQQSSHDSSNQEESGLAEANSTDLEAEQGVVIVDCENAEVSEPMQIAAQVAAVEIEVEQPAEAAAVENASAVSQEDYESNPDLAKPSAEDQTAKSTSQELTAVIVASDIEDTEQMIAVDQASVEAEHGSVVGDRLPEVEASLMEDQAESNQDTENQGEAEVDSPVQPVEESNASDLPASADNSDVSGENGKPDWQSEIDDPVAISTEIKDEAVDSSALDNGNASADVDENTGPEAAESPIDEVGVARGQQEQEFIKDSSPISQNDTESAPDQAVVLEQAQPEDNTETEQERIEVKSSSQSQVETGAEQEESTTEADAPQQSEQPADEAPADVSAEVTETQAAEETQPEPSKEEQPAEPEQGQEPAAQDEAPAEDPTEAPQEPPAQEESEPVAQQEETAEAPQEAAADVETSEPVAQEEATVEATVEATQEAPTDAEVGNAEEASTEPASESTPDSKEEEQKEEDQKEEAPAAEAPSGEPAAETTEEQKVEEPASEEPAAEAAESPKTEEPEKESAANAEEPESESTAQPAADGEVQKPP